MENKPELSKKSLMMIKSYRNNLKYFQGNENTGFIKLFQNIFKLIDTGKIKELKTLIEDHFKEDLREPNRIPNLNDVYDNNNF